MTVKNRVASRLAGAMLIAAMAAGVPASAEPSENSARTIPTTDARASPVKPVAKTPRSFAPQTAGAGNAKARPWSIEDALPARSSASNSAPPAPANKFGQIPWRNGTLGLATESQLNPYEAPEGRRLRSLENTNHNGPSYLGLSLSVPTNDKLFPVPAPPLSQPQ